MERDSYDSGDWFNRIDWTGRTNNWRVGLPSRDKDVANWPWIREIFADASIRPEAMHLAAAHAHLVELLQIRFSSLLFRLRTGDDIKKRVDFLNGGPDQLLGVIAMSITDGTCAGVDLDPNVEAIFVLINTGTTPQSIEVPGAAGFILHPVQAASADPVVRAASFTEATATFSVPGRTSAVFWKPQAMDQGDGLPCNTR
jgi:pullulanase/glycogen debranching enzyme